DLVRLADLLRAVRAAARRIAAADPSCPALAALAPAAAETTALLARIEKTLDRRGEVREDASPRLAALRREIRRSREQLYRDLSGYVAEHKETLSEETIPMRGGRLMLVLQAGARGRVGGLVHGRSATGKSLYFEPLEVVESNNSLQQAVEDEEGERRRIVNELLAEARAALPALHAEAEFLGELDFLQAAVRFGQRCDGALAEVGGRHDLRLHAARHPLLDPCLAELRQEALGQAGHVGPVVPLDLVLWSPPNLTQRVEFARAQVAEGRSSRQAQTSLELGGAARILVVTGPNAGGKTVALKTAGLLALAAQAGLPIPAARGSRVPFFARVVATVGDEQDLLADRSTFSGRLLRLREAWEAAGPDSLVLLDELGSGTDPEEGAALAVALLEGLLEKGALGVITTHLTQLAAAALELPGATCAAMEFDPATGRPTFRLVPGPPGGSEALALARRLGLPREWLDRAEARLGSEHRQLRRLLAEVERVRQELAAARDRMETEAADAEKLRRRLAAEREALEIERLALAKRLRAELDAFRRETAGKLREEVERLRQEVEAGRRRGLEAAAVERLFTAAPALPEPEPEEGGPLAVGGAVRHRRLGWQGVLEKLGADRAEVLVKGKRLACAPEDLVAVGGALPPAPAERKPRRAAKEQAAELEAAPTEINLIGQRVEPALEELDAYLDRALLGSGKEVRVVHGHGSGRLRDAIRRHLRTHPGVATLRPGAANEGGDGATVVTLRS
ncbi:MAG TPA: Smr/MutS family protein, partial [Thermoanaerobaculia bacterium]